MKFDLAIPESLKIVPYDSLLKALERDYQAMQGMMLGDVPNFNDLVKILERLETAIDRI